MIKDPVVEEVRQLRDEYAKQFTYDLEAIYRDLKEQEKKGGRKYVLLSPRRLNCAEQVAPGINQDSLTSRCS
ncbi:hypothetical protein HYR99_27570 [Candidatus Poribacteria bacterium]|nr:hypothetical protein [Candidatus Poribacteria bacterium]